MLKVGLSRLYDLEKRLGIPLYPIIGAGSVPFRGHLTPVNIERALKEYPSAHTFTVQSAFKYDYDKETVRDGIAQLRAHERREPTPVDQERARAIIDKTTAEYQAQVRRLITIISAVSRYVPRRRDRKLHVGLFGYGRTLDGVGDEVTLPRAIGFAASMYSIGIPPELLGSDGPGPGRPGLPQRGLPQHRRGLAGCPALHQRASRQGIAGRRLPGPGRASSLTR